MYLCMYVSKYHSNDHKLVYLEINTNHLDCFILSVVPSICCILVLIPTSVLVYSSPVVIFVLRLVTTLLSFAWPTPQLRRLCMIFMRHGLLEQHDSCKSFSIETVSTFRVTAHKHTRVNLSLVSSPSLWTFLT